MMVIKVLVSLGYVEAFCDCRVFLPLRCPTILDVQTTSAIVFRMGYCNKKLQDARRDETEREPGTPKRRQDLFVRVCWMCLP